MPRFFIDYTPEVGGVAVIEGGDARHIGGALRMTAGESLTLCDGKGTDYACTVTAVEKERVTLSVDAAAPSYSEPSLAVTLYMGLPKGDKMELIIQKAVELGVTAIVPVATARCIVKLDGKDAAKKQVRWQKIAAEAAGQSGRGIIPVVETPISWKTALTRFETEKTLLCYEGGGAPIGKLVSPADTAISLVVGPEGGFDPAEVEAVTAVGGKIATLGPRILRCETAPLAAIAVLMENSGNME
jgi:16S rRNA (uracil1498-N3)-methyltransferase